MGVHDYGDRRKLIHEGTALHKAATNGDVETAKLLIARGAKMQVKDPLQRRPCIRALEKKQEEAAAYLRPVYSTEYHRDVCSLLDSQLTPMYQPVVSACVICLRDDWSNDRRLQSLIL